jgi:hypothetical protein
MLDQLLNDKRAAYVLIAVGIIGAAFSILIDPLRDLDIYLHPIQIVGLVLGIILALVGVYLGFIRQPPPSA